MKIPQKKKVKRPENKKKTIVKPKKEHILVVAQEIKFARLLSGNEQKTRDRALKTLKKWLTNCFQKDYEFKDDDFSRIWKGLFYAVWMSDKPLVQEELCENIAGILDLFPPEHMKHALLMVKVGLRAIASEWYGIDQHRMDKCLMLVRRYLRGSLRVLSRAAWTERACKMYAKMLSGTDGILALKTPLYARNATSMILHFIDCYLEEISKVSEGKIPEDSLAELLRPICTYMCGGEAPSVCEASRRLLTALLRQSGEGLRYRDRTKAWEQMGCPDGGPDALVSDDDSDDEQEPQNDEYNGDDDDESERPLDPRAGRVSVLLSPLSVPSAKIADMLSTMLTHTASRAHKRAKLQMQRFQQLAKNQYPLKVPEVIAEKVEPLPSAGQAASVLQSLEKKLIGSSDELALRGLGRKHRKRLLARSRAGLSIVEDVAVLKASQHNATGDWQVDETEQPKKDGSNKENQNKQKKRKQKQNGDIVSAKKAKLESPKTTNKQSTDKKDAKMKNKKQKVATIIETPKKRELREKPKSNEPKKAPQKTEKAVPNSPKKALQKGEIAVKKTESKNKKSSPTVVAKKVKNFQKQLTSDTHSPKKVKFVLKNNSMQESFDYYKSVRQSPSIPFDSKKRPSKTNLKVSTPSPINPFFKKKWKINQ